MRMLFIGLVLMLFSSCAGYKGVLIVEKYPMQWSDTVIYKKDHWHFKSDQNQWTCVELDADTIFLDVTDTLYIEKFYFVDNKPKRK